MRGQDSLTDSLTLGRIAPRTLCSGTAGKRERNPPKKEREAKIRCTRSAILSSAYDSSARYPRWRPSSRQGRLECPALDGDDIWDGVWNVTDGVGPLIWRNVCAL